MSSIHMVIAQLTSGDVKIPKGRIDSVDFANGLRLLFGFAGAIAVIIIAFAGMQYVLSQGNPQATTKARNTIIDAFIGLAIIITGFSIVSFVVARLR